MESSATKDYIYKEFDTNVLPSLQDFVRIPNLSKMFDSEWKTNGLLDKAADHLIEWTKKQEVPGLTINKIQEPGKTPLLFIEIEAVDQNAKTLFFYGHLDKQPHFTGWADDAGPTDAVIKGNRLYGRGSVDDGYALYASILTVKAMKQAKVAHGKVYIMIEADEESEGDHLIYYLFDYGLKEKLTPKPDLIICLDSICYNNRSLTITSTLRGIICFNMKVEVLTEGVHSGMGSGIVPDTFRVARQLLNRIENSKTGETVDFLNVDIPSDKYRQLQERAAATTTDAAETYKVVSGASLVGRSELNRQINRLWTSQMAVIGADGLPPCNAAGNVLRPSTTLAVSIRTPPTLDTKKGFEQLKELLTTNIPYGAKVTLESPDCADGWNCPDFDQEFEKSIRAASKECIGEDAIFAGIGGSIPFINTLADFLPKSKFFVTGAALPDSNMHGPNESLELDFCKKVICAVTKIVSEF